MASISRTVTDIADGDVEFQKSLLEDQGFAVDVEEQPNGLFTLVGTKNDEANPGGQPANGAGFNDDLKAALRAAIRENEIGNDSPYQLSFAGKDNSGASFGFMQGDLAAQQPIVVSAFEQALKAAQISSAKITALMQALTGSLAQNPLSPEDTALINQALATDAGRTQVDAMDEALFESVCAQLAKCVTAAQASGNSITRAAQISMALWINMTGPPTTLLAWLSGQAVNFDGNTIAAPGSPVDGSAIQAYLAQTKFFVQNPQNLQHFEAAVQAGLQLLAADP